MFEIPPCLLLSTCAIDATWTEFSLFSCLKVLGFLVGFGFFYFLFFSSGMLGSLAFFHICNIFKAIKSWKLGWRKNSLPLVNWGKWWDLAAPEDIPRDRYDTGVFRGRTAVILYPFVCVISMTVLQGLFCSAWFLLISWSLPSQCSWLPRDARREQTLPSIACSLFSGFNNNQIQYWGV